MARVPDALALALVLVACGGAPPASVAEPVPATDRDPSTWVPTPAPTAQTGEPAALVLTGGDEQVRGLLVALVLAIRDANEGGIRALLAERVSHGPSGLARTTWPRETLAHQILAGAAASHVEPDASFESLVDPATIRVLDARTHFEGPLPAGVLPTDVVLSFTPTAEGRRLLVGIGSTALVVRPGPEPVVVAR